MDKFTEKIALYLEDMLPEEETIALEKHLTSCTTCQAEHTALKRIDTLFMNAPMRGPAPNFAARFEMRLERRVNQRRTWIGISIISSILIMATALLLWSVADSSLLLYNIFNNLDFLANILNFFEATLAGLTTLFNIAILLISAMTQALRHPAFWGYVILAVGVISFWAQILRWFDVTQQSNTLSMLK